MPFFAASVITDCHGYVPPPPVLPISLNTKAHQEDGFTLGHKRFGSGLQHPQALKQVVVFFFFMVGLFGFSLFFVSLATGRKEPVYL